MSMASPTRSQLSYPAASTVFVKTYATKSAMLKDNLMASKNKLTLMKVNFQSILFHRFIFYLAYAVH